MISATEGTPGSSVTKRNPCQFSSATGKRLKVLCLKTRILLPVRDADEAAIPRITPGVIRAGEYLIAPGFAIDQARTAVPADVGEGADLIVVAANDDDALAEVFERPPFARLRNLAFVADDLRRRAQEGALLGLEEFRVVIEPAGEAHVLQRVLGRLDRFQLRCHVPSLPLVESARNVSNSRRNLISVRLLALPWRRMDVKRLLTAILLSSAAMLGACQQKSATEGTVNDTAMTDDGAAMDNSATGATALDTAFVTDAMKGDNGEVAIGNLAADKATSSAAKDFGRMLATDHGAHKQKLAVLAATGGVPATDEPSDEAKANLAKLKDVSGPAFDKEFARLMVEDHQKDIAKYEKQASSGDPQTAALAKETLPTLRKHLQVAQGL